MAYRAGQAFVSVVPSLRGFQADVARQTRGMTAKVTVTVDDRGLAGLGEQISKVARNVTAKVGVDTGDSTVKLGLLDRALGRIDGQKVSARAEVDVAGAIRDTAALLLAVNAFANRKYTFHVEADTAGAVASVARLVGMVSALGGAAGIVGGLGGALAGLAPVGAAAAGGLGSVVLASAGVGDALKAMSAQQKTSAVDAAASAKSQSAAAETVRSAQERAASASIDADRARRDGARSVADAEQQAADSIASALSSAQSAHRSYASALTDVRRAQTDLNKAYEEGRRGLQDIQDQLDSSQIDQRQAAIDLRDALDELNAAKASGNAREIEKAQVAYDRQVETVDQLSKRVQRLQVDNTKAQAAGVQGTDQVTSATQRLSDANASAADAKRAADAADAALTRARSDAVRNVALAQESASQRISDADKAAASAQRALQVALADTGDSGSAAGQKVAQAFAELSPPAAAFARYLFSLKPMLEGLQATAAAGIFPGLTAGLQALVSQGPAITTMVQGLAAGTGAALQYILTQLASPEWITFGTLISQLAVTWLPEAARIGMLFAAVVRDLLTAFIPLAPAGFALLEALAGLLSYAIPFLVQFLQPMIPAAMAFLDALRPLFPVLAALGPILGILGLALAQVLGPLLQVLAPILVALTPLIQAFATQLATSLVASLQAVAPFLLMFATWLGQNPGLVIGVVTAIGTLMGFLKPLAFVLGIVVSALHSFIIIAVVKALLSGLGLEATLFGRAILLILSPINLFRAVMGILPRLLPLIGQGISFIGRAILGAMGPVGWLITAFTLLYSTNEQFRNAINGLLGTLMGLVSQVLDALMPAFNALMGAIMPLIPLLIGALVPIFNVLAAILVDLINMILPPLVMIIQNVLVPVIKFLADILAGVLVWAITTLVVPALQALTWFMQNVVAPVIMWLYQNIVKPAFEAVGAIVTNVWFNILQPAFQALWWFISNVLGPVFVWLYQNIVLPYFNLIGALVSFWWNYIILPIFNAIMWLIQNGLGPVFQWLYDHVVKPVFDAIGAVINFVWLTVIKPAWDNMMAGLDWLGRGFDNAVKWIGDIWRGLKNLLAVPINFMIGTVFNGGIVPAWNFAADLLPGIDPIAPLPLIPEFASGGLLRGPGDGTSDSILAAVGNSPIRVSDGEYIVNADVTKRTLPFLEALNSGNGEALQAAGGLAKVAKTYRGPNSGIEAYAAGGPIDQRIIEAKKWLSGPAQGIPYVWGGGGMGGMDCSGMQAAVTHILSGRSPTSGRIGTTASMPWGGFVGGLDGAYAIGNKPADHMAGTLDGQNVEQHGPNGDPFRFPSRWGADNGYFTQQFHLQQLGGQFVSGGQGGGGGNWILDQIRAFYNDTTQPVIDGIKAYMGPPPPKYRAIPPDLAVKARDSIGDFLFGQAAAAGGGAMDTSAITGPVVDQVRQVARTYGWDVGPEWDALSALIAKESSWDPNAANRSSSARGLFQKMTSLHGPVEKTPAAQAAWGLDYIQGKYGDPISAWAFHRQHNSYDDGGYLEPGVFNGTRRPEPVFTGSQWDDISTLAARGAGTFQGDLYLDSGEFLGVVHGVVQDDLDSVGTALSHGRR